MKQYFTTYWKYPDESRNQQTPFTPVQVSGSNVYQQRGVRFGDSVYVVSAKAINGDLCPYIFGRIQVERLVSRSEAVELSGECDLWDADEWLWDPRGTPHNPYRRLHPEIWSEFRFGASDSACKDIWKNSPTSLNNQTLRGVRQLRPIAGEFLDLVIEVTDKMPRHNRDFVVTKQMLSPHRSV